MRHWFPVVALLVVGACQQQACPSAPGGPCNPDSAKCPKSYHCAKAEICTKPCEEARDCWVRVEDGCYYERLPGQLMADGGPFTETSDEGFCPDTRSMACVDGYCQRGECADGGCDLDLYRPSEFRGNQTQGPGTK